MKNKRTIKPESNDPMQMRLPDAAVQRDILIKKRDEYLAIAFNADLEIEGLLVQEPTGTSEEIAEQSKNAKEDTLANLRSFAANIRKAAARMDELIAKIPAASPLGVSPFLQ